MASGGIVQARSSNHNAVGDRKPSQQMGLCTQGLRNLCGVEHPNAAWLWRSAEFRGIASLAHVQRRARGKQFREAYYRPAYRAVSRNATAWLTALGAEKKRQAVSRMFLRQRPSLRCSRPDLSAEPLTGTPQRARLFSSCSI